MTNKGGIHRVTSDSKRGRQLTGGGGVTVDPYRKRDPETEAWNKAIEQRKADKAKRRATK